MAEPGIKPRRQSILIGQRSLDVYAEGTQDQGEPQLDSLEPQ